MSPFNFPPTPQSPTSSSSPLDPISSAKQSDPRTAWGWTILGFLSCFGGLASFLSLAFYAPIQKMDVPLKHISSVIIGLAIAFRLAIKSIPGLKSQWGKFKNFINKANRLYYFMRGVGFAFLLIICVSMGALIYGALAPQ